MLRSRKPTPLIAAVTMVRSEAYFLPRWISHWSAVLPREHLFILLDGADQPVPPEAKGCQIITLPRLAPGPGWDRRRWQMLSHFAAALLGRFEITVLNDVDELLLADPGSGRSLLDCITAAAGKAISPFGVELLHRIDLEPAPLNPDAPILGQRNHARINAAYSKPCVIGRPVNWSVGGHYSDHPDLHLDPDLYLFHLRFVDRDMLMARQAQRQTVANTVRRHQEIAAGGGWTKDMQQLDDFLQSFLRQPPEPEADWGFAWQRARLQSSWAQSEDGFWRHARLHNRRSYRIPQRFVGLI